MAVCGRTTLGGRRNSAEYFLVKEIEEEHLYVRIVSVGRRDALAGAESADSGWDLISMWHNMGIPAKSVVILLFLMSAWSVGIMIDRALMYSAARKQSRVFVQQVAGALKDNKLDEAISIAERNKKSHIAKVVATGLSEFQAASSQVSGEEVVEAARRGLDRSVAIVHAEMKRGLSGLAT